MSTLRSLLLASLAFSILAPLSALAATVEVKAAKGIDKEKREPQEPADTFAPKDTVWIWTRVKDGAGSKIKYVWKHDGKEVWSKEMSIGSKDWITNTRRVVKAGSWTVEVLGDDGAKLAEATFTVK